MIPSGITGNQAQAVFAAMHASLDSALDKVTSWDSTGLGMVINPGVQAEAERYCNSIAEMLTKYEPDFEPDDNSVSAQGLIELRACVSCHSVACKYVDDNFSTTFLSEFQTSLEQAVHTVIGSVAATIGGLAPSFLAATWWIWAAAIVALVLVHEFKKEVA